MVVLVIVVLICIYLCGYYLVIPYKFHFIFLLFLLKCGCIPLLLDTVLVKACMYIYSLLFRVHLTAVWGVFKCSMHSSTQML